jgi:hypothetical protein
VLRCIDALLVQDRRSLQVRLTQEGRSVAGVVIVPLGDPPAGTADSYQFDGVKIGRLTRFGQRRAGPDEAMARIPNVVVIDRGM